MTETTTPEAKADQTAPEAPAFRHDATALRERRESLNISRNMLAELTGLSLSRLWASEQDDKQITEEHHRLIVAALDNVTANGLPEHLRPKMRPGRTSKLVRVSAIIDEALEARTMKEMRALVESAKAVINEATGATGTSVSDQPSV